MMDIEYEIAREGCELFKDDPIDDVWIPWEPDHSEKYPLVLDE